MPFEHFITLYSTAIYLITLTFLVTPRVGLRTPDWCLAVPGSNPALSSQSPGGLPPGMALAEANLCEGQQRRKLFLKMYHWFAENK